MAVIRCSYLETDQVAITKRKFTRMKVFTKYSFHIDNVSDPLALTKIYGSLKILARRFVTYAMVDIDNSKGNDIMRCLKYMSYYEL